MGPNEDKNVWGDIMKSVDIMGRWENFVAYSKAVLSIESDLDSSVSHKNSLRSFLSAVMHLYILKAAKKAFRRRIRQPKCDHVARTPIYAIHLTPMRAMLKTVQPSSS
jgi:hypothetical protein